LFFICYIPGWTKKNATKFLLSIKTIMYHFEILTVFYLVKKGSLFEKVIRNNFEIIMYVLL